MSFINTDQIKYTKYKIIITLIINWFDLNKWPLTDLNLSIFDFTNQTFSVDQLRTPNVHF